MFIRAFACSLFALTSVGVAAPAASPPPDKIPLRVTIGGIRVGGLTAEPARASVRKAFDRRLRFRSEDKRWSETPQTVGATAYSGRAVTAALYAPPGRRGAAPDQGQPGEAASVRRGARQEAVASGRRRLRRRSIEQLYADPERRGAGTASAAPGDGGADRQVARGEQAEADPAGLAVHPADPDRRELRAGDRDPPWGPPARACTTARLRGARSRSPSGSRRSRRRSGAGASSTCK